MATEIERKFLTLNDDWRREVSDSTRMVQGYLMRGEDTAIRVRVAGDQAWLNIKKNIDGVHRLEFEYQLPLDDAQAMLGDVVDGPVIDKTRHLVARGDHTWEIDEFHGDNAGLVVAELELTRADEPFDRPAWLGDEVSTDPRYFNSQLSVRPYSNW